MKSKIIIIAILAIVTFFGENSAFAQTSALARFTIDKATYEGLSESQKTALTQKIQELSAFVEKEIKGKLPANILQKISDLKIKISFTDTPGRDGLFVPGDVGEEHTVSIQLIQAQSNGIKALIAHEVYHAIHFHINPDELPWVREGMAQVFEYIHTNKLNGLNMAAAISNPMTPLLGEYNPETSERAQYGHNMLYFYYLYNQCGGEKLFWKITEGAPELNLKGSYLMDTVLKEIDFPNEECSDFAKSAILFEVAKMHNKPQILNSKEKTKFFVIDSDLTTVFPQVKTEKDLERIIKGMPVLSSYKIPMENFITLKGKCSNCEIYYSNKAIPYNVSSKAPEKSKGIDVILVKLRRN
ncbi:MAG: hypothetical protein K2Q18_09255 [Bdellovibrionales bacterium]|nr:hypothetical protein [Bdellovibrionales bacterium]